MQSITFEKNHKTFFIDFSEEQIKGFWKNLYRDVLFEANKFYMGETVSTIGLFNHYEKDNIISMLNDYEKEIYKLADKPIHLEETVNEYSDVLEFNSKGFLKTGCFIDILNLSVFAIKDKKSKCYRVPVLRFQARSSDLLELRMKYINMDWRGLPLKKIRKK